MSSLTTGLPDTRNVCDWLGVHGRRFATLSITKAGPSAASVVLALWDRDDSGRLTSAGWSAPMLMRMDANDEADVLVATLAHALASDHVTGESRGTMLYRVFWHLYRRSMGVRAMVRGFAPSWASMVADAIEVGR